MPCLWLVVAQNRLINETSPYLLQHAHNPVDWYGWGDEALQKARDENRPIFLSIGYSSCHWCHVMAHESFENDEVARFMNENFVNIKVDREERPDIDDIYQKACQMATGQGGWPLSVFLTPDQKPFYVGTYFPVLDSYGRPGFGGICRQLAQAWQERPADILKKAGDFVDAMQNEDAAGTRSDMDRVILDEAAMNLLGMGDTIYGGFGSAPKFPNAACVSFLFAYSEFSKLPRFREFALKTLTKMAKGGIFDQIGGGFHRYSTDARWFAPHFEKMLYDNALVPVNYAEAYQITGDAFYLEVMQKTLDFVLREMRSPDGGFYSAYDADSEGDEGRFYVWSKGEIRSALGSDADLFCLFYDVTDGGNWEGSNILCNNINISAVAFKFGITEQRVREILAECSEKLMKIRSARTPPGLDDKILVSWNALMITALARGYRVAGDARYLEAAKACISFLEANVIDGDTILHTYKDGTAKIDGYLEDYACLANALLDVFGIDPDPRYLELAIRLGRRLAGHFWDSRAGCFMMTSDAHEALIVRPKSKYDLSLPSGNSVSALVMLRLYHMSQDAEFLDICTRVMESGAEEAARNPFAFGYLLNVISTYLQKPAEVTIINPENQDLCRSILSRYMPNAFVVTVQDPAQLAGLSGYAFFAGKEFESRTSVFVCKDLSCLPPMYSVAEVERHL